MSTPALSAVLCPGSRWIRTASPGAGDMHTVVAVESDGGEPEVITWGDPSATSENHGPPRFPFRGMSHGHSFLGPVTQFLSEFAKLKT